MKINNTFCMTCESFIDITNSFNIFFVPTSIDGPTYVRSIGD